jgi:UDP-N-acetylmuramoylalanine--D-glutamate ligase
MKHIAILGFGREGASLFAFLKKSKKYRDAEIWVLDQNQNTKTPKGIKTQLGKSYLKNLSRFEAIFRSPGIPYRTPELLKAQREGVEISSATKLFFEHCKGTIIGVTGTKGKGTTTTLLFKILKAAKKDTVLVGNIGVPALDLLPRITKSTLVVFELSSFQLQDLTISPHIAGLLDMFPDHQDSHLNLREYYSAKERITRFQNPHDVLFYIEGNKIVSGIAKKSKAKKIGVGTKKWKLFSQDELSIPGAHNFKNAVMAGTIARHLGISDAIIKKTTLSFKGNEHRLELVRTVRGTELVSGTEVAPEDIRRRFPELKLVEPPVAKAIRYLNENPDVGKHKPAIVPAGDKLIYVEPGIGATRNLRHVRPRKYPSEISVLGQVAA